MSKTRYASALGLGFGDCGKGHFIDALARRWQARAVVRFNGGAQAGHNVVTSATAGSPARHHTFSQFGAGTFVPGVRTLLVDPMVAHPSGLLVEAEALARVGVHDALSRLGIDGRCRITTPFHQAAGRLRELLRGNAAHGTCGVGVGETVRHGLEHPGQDLRYADLQANARTVLEKLQAIRETLLAEFAPRHVEGKSSDETRELATLGDESIAAKWLAVAQALVRQCPPLSDEQLARQLTGPGCVLFEGAQGVLLDEWRGFHPHTTWSTINTFAVDGVVARFGIEAEIEHYGVMRTYLTRHGNGPLPTQDPTLDDLLPEPHNSGAGWQGAFRRGHPDAVLLRYALEAVGKLSGLFVSHLDVFDRGVTLKWCERYVTPRVERLPLSAGENLAHQLSLTELLRNGRPEYASGRIASASDFFGRVSEVASVPIALISHGTGAEDVRHI